jgi:hypothetical protein
MQRQGGHACQEVQTDIMQRFYLWTLALIITSQSTNAQDKALRFNAGASFSAATSFPNNSSANATGIGIDLSMEKQILPKLSWTLRGGITFFSGNYKYITYIYDYGIVAIPHFALIPLTTGLRYYYLKNLYLGGEAGLMIKGSSNTGTHSMLMPSAGYLIPAGKSRIDLGISWVYINRGFRAPENNALKNGGYNFWSFRVTYAL